MDAIFANLAIGFSTAMTAYNILWVFIGGLLGTIMGMLPGLGPTTGIALLMPLTFTMHPDTALVTMCAIYYGAMFGGSRSSGPEMHTEPSSLRFMPKTGADTVETPGSRSPIDH